MVNAQVKVLGKIEPNGLADTYPTHVDSLGRGGFVAVKTWQERNNIPLPRRKAGMMVSVKSATVDSLYRLGVGLSNADWLPYAPTVDVSGKANTTGSNATGTWPISINGSAMQWGGRTADFSSSSSNVPTHILGFDGVNDISRLYQLGAVKTALNISDGSTLSNNIDGSAGNSTNWNGLLRNAGNIPDPSGGIMTLNSNGTSSGYTSVNQMKIALGVDNKANLNGGNTLVGPQTIDSEDGLFVINSESEGSWTSLIAGNLALFSGSSGEAFFNAAQTTMSNPNGRFMVDLQSDGRTISLGKPSSGGSYYTTNIKLDNSITSSNTVTLPASTGTLALMEQVLAMTEVQLQTYHGGDIVGTTVTITTSPSRYKKVYVYKAGDIDNTTVFQLPANPAVGDLVEIMAIGSMFLFEFIEIRTASGTFLNSGSTYLMSYKWNGTSWAYQGLE